MDKEKKLKIGIVGTGYIANLYLEALRKINNADILACCDTNLKRAEGFGKKWGIAQICNSITQLLGDKHLDAIFVLTSPDSHYPVAKEIVKAKVNVFLEKPMTTLSRDCDELNQLANANGVKIGVNHSAIFHPLFLRLKRDIALKHIGKVSRVMIYQILPLRQLESGKLSHWMFNNPQNIIFEQAPHPFSQIRALLGEFIDIKTTTYGKKEIAPGQFFYDSWQIVAECENGLAYVHLSFNSQCFPQNILFVNGQDGAIQADLLRNLYLLQDKTTLPDYLESFGNGFRHLGCVFQGMGNFLNYNLSKIKFKKRSDIFYLSIKNSIEAFCSAVKENQNLPVSGEDGYKIILACEKAVESANLCENINYNRIALKNKNPEILVTGANGFIGAALVEKLVKNGKTVRVFVRSNQGLKKSLLSSNVEIQTGSITELQDIKKAVRGIRYVYHLAHGGSDTWESFYEVNVSGTRYLAEEVLRENVKYFIYTSTIATYYYGLFPKGSFITEESPIDDKPQMRSFYARSKILAEQLLMQMYKEKKLPLVMFRPAIVMGENGSLYHGGVGQWIRDNVCDYWGMGKNPLPFVLVKDVTEALLKALSVEGLEGQIFNLAGDVEFSAQEYIKYLKARSHRNIKASPYPIPLLFLSESFKYLIKKATGNKDALLSYRDINTRSIPVRFDCSKTKRVLSWQPCSDKNVFIEKAIGWAFNGEK